MLKFLVDEEQRFNSLPMKDQMSVVLDDMILRNMRELRTQILYELDPEGNYERQLELMLFKDPTFRHYERWLIQNCQRNKEYCEKVIKELDRVIQKG